MSTHPEIYIVIDRISYGDHYDVVHLPVDPDATYRGSRFFIEDDTVKFEHLSGSTEPKPTMVHYHFERDQEDLFELDIDDD